jgi:hypothetical protein
VGHPGGGHFRGADPGYLAGNGFSLFSVLIEGGETMNERLLKIIVYVAGAICLYAFIAVRVPSLFNAVLKEKIIPEYWENTKYGELYYFSFIHNFREKGLPPCSKKYRFTEKQPSVHDADIYIFGDSYFDFSRMKTFPERLGDTLGMRAFYERMDRPLHYFAEHGFENSKEKILLYESAERYIPTRFSAPHQTGLTVDSRSWFRQKAAAVRDVIFQPNTDVLYGTFLSRNILTTDIFSFNATLKFNVFGYITKMTPKYYLGGGTPWLFYYDQLNEEPGSFYYHHSNDEINTYCDNIADLSEKLYKEYKLKMVFMSVPSKYTICHTLLNDDPYNNFLPRIYEGLEERGIPVIHLYEDFKNSDKVLYYGTDTHWRAEGVSMALHNTLELFKNLEN